MLHPLHRLAFAWHDLPVEHIAIVARGVIIDVLPYNEDSKGYDRATLSLLDAEAIAFDVNGQLTPEDLHNLEIAKFEVAEFAPGRITGTLGILPGRGGYWTIQVTNALWRVSRHGPAATGLPVQA